MFAVLNAYAIIFPRGFSETETNYLSLFSKRSDALSRSMNIKM